MDFLKSFSFSAFAFVFGLGIFFSNDPLKKPEFAAVAALLCFALAATILFSGLFEE